jgi:hypothetical protein
MAFLDLANLGTTTFRKAQTVNEFARSYGTQPTYHVFLSYRHADRHYIPKIADFLRSLNSGIYVDYLDEELNQAPSSQTAPILRSRINQSKKLIQLITPNSGQSKWMPWELGLGDGLIGYPHTVVLPTVNGVQRIQDQDYQKMYGYIDNGLSRDNTIRDWFISYPDGKGVWFKDWLKS